MDGQEEFRLSADRPVEQPNFLGTQRAVKHHELVEQTVVGKGVHPVAQGEIRTLAKGLTRSLAGLV